MPGTAEWLKDRKASYEGALLPELLFGKTLHKGDDLLRNIHRTLFNCEVACVQ